MANQTPNTPSTSSNTVTINVASLSNAIAVALQQASNHHASSLSPPFQSPIPAASASSSTGRPQIRIELNVVLELRKLNYKWTKIASLLGVSRATLYR